MLSVLILIFLRRLLQDLFVLADAAAGLGAALRAMEEEGAKRAPLKGLQLRLLGANVEYLGETSRRLCEQLLAALHGCSTSGGVVVVDN